MFVVPKRTRQKIHGRSTTHGYPIEGVEATDAMRPQVSNCLLCIVLHTDEGHVPRRVMPVRCGKADISVRPRPLPALRTPKPVRPHTGTSTGSLHALVQTRKPSSWLHHESYLIRLTLGVTALPCCLTTTPQASNVLAMRQGKRQSTCAKKPKSRHTGSPLS